MDVWVWRNRSALRGVTSAVIVGGSLVAAAGVAGAVFGGAWRAGFTMVGAGFLLSGVHLVVRAVVEYTIDRFRSDQAFARNHAGEALPRAGTGGVAASGVQGRASGSTGPVRVARAGTAGGGA
jgi:hypothetical protein